MDKPTVVCPKNRTLLRNKKVHKVDPKNPMLSEENQTRKSDPVHSKCPEQANLEPEVRQEAARGWGWEWD